MTQWLVAVQRWLQAGERYRVETSTALADFRCAYCGAAAETIDHVVPRVLGGRDEVSNLVPACRSCNGSKGARPLVAWLDWMRSVQARIAGAEHVLDLMAPTDDFNDPAFLEAWRQAEERRSA